MLYLEINHLHYNWPGGDDLFQGLSATLSQGDSVGLVGANGRGKSTLLQLILGFLTPDSGQIHCLNGIKAGWLPQDPLKYSEILAGDWLFDAIPGLLTLRQEQQKVLRNESDDWTVLTRYEETGGYNLEFRLAQELPRFSLPEDVLQRSLSSLSGGERTRLGLLRLVLADADLLLLDEPTNHLDGEGIDWLTHWLRQDYRTFIAVSHDRAFLDTACSSIWSLTPTGTMDVFSGNWTEWKEQRLAEEENLRARREAGLERVNRLQTQARSHRQWASRFQAETGRNGYAPVYESITNDGKRAMKRAISLEKRIERLVEKELEEMPWIDKKYRFHVPGGELPGRIALECSELQAGFDSPLFPPLSFQLKPGRRLAVTGPNGCGKSTLLNVLYGNLSPLRGCFRWPPQVRTGLLGQDADDLLPEQSLLDAVAPPDRDAETAARNLLGRLYIRGGTVLRRSRDVSPGERLKAAFVAAVFGGVNVLLLDEPTNHLDLLSREALEEALLAWQGTLIFVSHDRRFVEKLATHELYLPMGKVISNEN